MTEVREYIDHLDRNHFHRWFLRLDANTQARIVVALDRLERGSLATTKGVGKGIFELRLDFGPGYRVYFGKDGGALIILLGGGTKQRQQADIEIAHALWLEYKKQKRTY